MEQRGAAGLVSYAANQVSAWWRDDQDLVRWGHLDARGRRNTFALMVSLREARALQQRLGQGERITLHAVVRARNDDTMPYRRSSRPCPARTPRGEIVFSCHLDHEKPGANDNASGCAANLEIADPQDAGGRGRIPPRRTIRSSGLGDDGHDRVPREAPGDRRGSARPCTWTWWAAIRS